MRSPKGTDYLEAIQHPLRCFRDETLRRGQPVLDERGKPLAHTGRYADIYEVRCPAARERWAIKCFTRQQPGLQRRYLALQEHLLGLHVPALVAAEYHDQGLSLRGRLFPIVKMRWVEGRRLNDYIRDFCAQPQVLLHLADLWHDLARDLRRAGVAHGNLQHDHVRVGLAPNGTLALHAIDYDGMFVPALAGEPPEKLGHPNFQHPQRLWQKLCDADSDRFPNLVIYTALHALAVGGPPLWERFDHGDNLLFREHDFQDPASSALMQALWRIHDPVVHSLAGQLLLACQGSPTEIPLLEDVANGRPLTAAQQEEIAAVLAEADGAARPSAPLANGESFDLVVDDEPSLSLPARAVPPVLPCAPTASLATAVFDHNALPAPPKLLPAMPVPVVVLEPADGPEVAVYHLEAWMPEQIAVIKMQGFVREQDARLVESVPGLVHVQMVDRYYVPPDAPAPGLLTWLGLVPPAPPAPRLLAELTLHLRHKVTDSRSLLEITVRIRPGRDAEPDDPGWRTYCDRLFCNLRGFLMGNS